MLITDNIRLSRILKNTWKVDLVMIASSIIAYLSNRFLISHHFEIPVIIPTVLGTAIAFFIGFNNNQAYDRWWEARKVWGGLVNDSRSWARSILEYPSGGDASEEELTVLKHRMIRRQIAFVYALKAALRGLPDNTWQSYLSDRDVDEVENQSNIQNAILHLQARDLQRLSEHGAIDGYRLIQLDNLLSKITDEMGMSERIAKTVFPTTYSYLTKAFIWIFVVSIALVTAQYVGKWSIFISAIIGFVFVSTQINGMNLVNPFSTNSAAIPLNQISRTIEINLLQMMGEREVPSPVTPINDEYIL